MKKNLLKIVDEATAEEILEHAERIFKETWKRAVNDPEVTFYDVAKDILGEL